ncbi:MAG: hypothetical protein RXQ99_10155, partial [Acidianus sp.]|uniref:hypothetical protein n=1 Tax=Acidianus sp. TaxID=1872104 RepID=UPI00397BAEA1
LRPIELTRLLIRLYCSKPKLSVFLVGYHGVGKSTVVRDVAKYLADHPCPGSTKKIFVEISKLTTGFAKIKNEEGKEVYISQADVFRNPKNFFLFYDLRLTELEPQDLMGLPRITGLYISSTESKSITTYAPPSWAMLLSIPGIEGILFLDELTNVQRTDVISAAYKLFLDKSSGNLKFSENVMVVSAGNPVPGTAEESARYGIANPLPAPLLNRVIVIGVLPPTIEEWKAYMDREYGNNWDTTVYEFLSAKPEFSWENISRRNYQVYENEPTPRSYTNLALISIQLRDNKEQLKSAAIGLIGSVAGNAFYKYVTETKKNVTAEQLLKNYQLLFTTNFRREELVELAHAVATLYRTNKTDVTNFFLAVLRSLPSLSEDKAEIAKDFLLAFYNSLSVEEKEGIRTATMLNGLSSIWSKLIR